MSDGCGLNEQNVLLSSRVKSFPMKTPYVTHRGNIGPWVDAMSRNTQENRVGL
jgi:hypothetical protein